MIDRRVPYWWVADPTARARWARKQEAKYLLMSLAVHLGGERDKQLRGQSPDAARAARLIVLCARARARFARRLATSRGEC